MHRKYTITGPGPPPDPGVEACQRSPASAGHVTMSSRDNLAVDLSASARDVRSKIPVRSQCRSQTPDNHTNNRFGMKSKQRCSSAAELYIGTKIPITPRMSRSGRTIWGTSGAYTPEFTPCFGVETPHSVNSPKVTSTVRSSRLPVATGNRSTRPSSMCKTTSSSRVVQSPKSGAPLRQWTGTKIPVRVPTSVDKAKVGDSGEAVEEVNMEAVDSDVEVEVSSELGEEDFDRKVVESESVDSDVEVSNADDDATEVSIDTIVDIRKMNIEALSYMDNRQISREQSLAFQDQIISKEIELREKLRNLDELLDAFFETRSEVDGLATKLHEVHVAIDDKALVDGVCDFRQEIERFNSICLETECVDKKYSFFPQNTIAKAMEEHKIEEDINVEDINSLLERIRMADASEIVSLTKSFVMGSNTKHDMCDVNELNSSIDAIMDKYKLSEPKVDDNVELTKHVHRPVVNVYLNGGEFNLDRYDKFRDKTKFVPALDDLDEEGEENGDDNVEITHTCTVDNDTKETMLGDIVTDSVQSKTNNLSDVGCLEELQTIDNKDTGKINSDIVNKTAGYVAEHLDISEDLHEMRRELINKYATVDIKENEPDNERDGIENEMNLMHAWNEYSDLGDEDEIGNLLEAINCMKRHAALGNTNVQHTIDIMVDKFIVGGNDVEEIDTQPDDNTATKGYKNNEKSDEDTNTTDTRDDVDGYEKTGEDINRTDPKYDDDYEKPGEDTNPTDSRDNDGYETPGEDTNPTDPRENDGYEKTGEDTNSTDPRGNDGYEKTGEDTNSTDPRDNDGYEKPGEDTKPTDPRDNDGYEKTGEDTNSTDPRDNDGYEKSGEDTNPTDPRDNDGYEKTGVDTNTTNPIDDVDVNVSPGEANNTKRYNDDEKQALKEERLAIEEEFVKNRKRHESDISNIRRFWRNTAGFVFEEVKKMLIEATCTSDDAEPIQCQNMDSLMQIVLKAISSNTLEVINEICETNKDKSTELLMYEVMEGLNQHKMNIISNEKANTDTVQHSGKDHVHDISMDTPKRCYEACGCKEKSENADIATEALKSEFDVNEVDKGSSSSGRSECSIAIMFNNAYETKKSPNKAMEMEKCESNRTLSVKSQNDIDNEVDINKELTYCESLEYMGSPSPCSLELGNLSNTSVHTVDTRCGKEQAMSEWFGNSDTFIKCEKLIYIPMISPTKHESGYTADYEGTDFMISPTKYESAEYEEDNDEQSFRHENVNTNIEDTKSSNTKSCRQPLMYSRCSVLPSPEYKGIDGVSNTIHTDNDTTHGVAIKTEVQPNSPLRGPEVRGIFKNIDRAKQRNTDGTRKAACITERRKPALKTEIKIDFAGLRIDGTNINDAKPNKTPRPKISKGAIKLITKCGLNNVRLSKKHSAHVETTKREILDVFTPNHQVPTRRQGLEVDSYSIKRQPSLNPHQVLPAITPANGTQRNINLPTSSTANSSQTPSADFLATPLPAIKSKHHRKYGK